MTDIRFSSFVDAPYLDVAEHRRQQRYFKAESILAHNVCRPEEISVLLLVRFPSICGEACLGYINCRMEGCRQRTQCIPGMTHLCRSDTSSDVMEKSPKLTSIFDSLHTQTKPFFLVKLTGDTVEVHSMDEADTLFTGDASDSVSS